MRKHYSKWEYMLIIKNIIFVFFVVVVYLHDFYETYELELRILP